MAYISKETVSQSPAGAYISRSQAKCPTCQVVPQQLEDLQSAGIKTPRMTFAGQTVIAKCVSVYDGDTAQFVWLVNDKHYRFTCRMAGYNSAEINGSTELEYKLAQKHKQALQDKILNKIVQLDLGHYDKYGRILVTVTFDGIAEQPADMLEHESVNSWMIRTKNGFVYNGSGEKKNGTAAN
jgi:endonuclease YncB( thermonuclease family)